MKKLLVALAFVLFVWVSFWTSIELQQTVSIEQNIWSTNLSTLTIDFSGAIQDSFTISLGSDKLIFLNSYDWDLNYTISDNHKQINFENNEDEIVIVDGLKVRTYDDTVNNSRIGLDIDNNWEIDYYTTKYISVSSDENSDYTKPLPIGNLGYSIEDKDIILSRTRSPSLDAVKQVVRIYKNGNFYMDKYMSAWDESITLENYYNSKDSHTIEVYAKDVYYWWESTSINIEPEKIIIDKVERYYTEVEDYVITTISDYIDSLIDIRYIEESLEKNKVIEYRNEFIKTLENFITKRITQTEAKTEFAVSLWKLMPLIK